MDEVKFPLSTDRGSNGIDPSVAIDDFASSANWKAKRRQWTMKDCAMRTKWNEAVVEPTAALPVEDRLTFFGKNKKKFKFPD